MAIYHFSGQIMNKISKQGKYKSPLACAAYRSGDKLHDEKEDIDFYYMRKVKPVTHILAPNHAPSWVYDREKLWNEVNRIEKNINSQFAREFNVALPIELSREEQEKLTLDFCQTAFVEKGMVADIAIHRDDESNPHFHVMLTMRPFNEDGTWGHKAKRQYKFDENGNHVLDKNGKKAFVKVPTTDWNEKKTFENWRKLWAEKANEYLEMNGFVERISHLSHRDNGFETLPTKHEGYVARKMVSKGKESDLILHNEKIKQYNKIVTELNKYKRQKEKVVYENKFVRRFSPSEKKMLSSIAKELKMFVSYSSLLERKEQLLKWSKSIRFKPDNEEKFKMLNRIEKENELIEQAEQILNQESERFIKANYPTWDLNSLEEHEKISIVDETIKQNKILSEDEIDMILDESNEEYLHSKIHEILENRYAFVLAIDKKMNELNTQRNKLETLMNINSADFENSLKKASIEFPNEIKVLKQNVKAINDLYEAKDLVEELYNLEMKKLYPEHDSSHLSLEEKEILIVGYEYYEQPITLELLESGELRNYTTTEQKEIIQLLTNKNDSNRFKTLKTLYPNFQFYNPRYVLLFKEECIHNIDNLDKESIDKLKSIDPVKMAQSKLNNSSILENYNYSLDEQIASHSAGSSIVPGYVAGGILSALTKNRSYASKKQFEEDLKRKNRKKKNVHRGGHSI